MTKQRVAIICGGQSPEHAVSLQSAKNVVAALDTARFTPVLIGIDHDGGWHQLSKLGNSVATGGDKTDSIALLKDADVAFPVLHGPFGEDGSIQGLFEMAGVPYVGCGVLSSAVGMDKDVMKRLLRDAGVAVADYAVVTPATRETCEPAAIVERLGLPLFVKPASMGSSVGVSKVSEVKALLPAIDHALAYDRKVLIETAIVGDEVECAVLGNDVPKVSAPGRIVPKADFYDYEAKYSIGNETKLEIPAEISPRMARKVQDIALTTYTTLGCAGMARVDMFVTTQGDVIVNEINTIPGFTKFSMYPQLWEASGLSYGQLITRLIDLALERFEQRQKFNAAYKQK